MHYDMNKWELNVGDRVKIYSRDDRLYIILRFTKDNRALIKAGSHYEVITCAKLKWSH